MKDEFSILFDSFQKYILRLEPAKRGKLQFTHEIITEMAKLFKGSDKIPVIRCVEFANDEKLGANVRHL